VATLISYPQDNEYFSYYGNYIKNVPQDADIFKLLDEQIAQLSQVLQMTNDAEASLRPAPEEWSIKEVLGHICDTERIFAYRALRFLRADTNALPGFEQDDYVKATDFNKRSLASLVDEFTFQRKGNLLCFQNITEEESIRTGTASTYTFSVRALIFIMAGHVAHHIESLKTSYKLGAN
jgi:hypothetical protein